MEMEIKIEMNERVATRAFPLYGFRTTITIAELPFFLIIIRSTPPSTRADEAIIFGVCL